MNSDALVAELVETSNGKDPREAAWAAGQDVVAIEYTDGSTSRFAMWREGILVDGLFFSSRLSEDDWYICLGAPFRVGEIHGQTCLIFTEV